MTALTTLRIAKGFGAYQFAKRAGIRPDTLRRAERGQPVRRETQRKIVKAFGWEWYVRAQRERVFPA